MRNRVNRLLFEASHGQTILHVIVESCNIQVQLIRHYASTEPATTADEILWQCTYQHAQIADFPMLACRQLTQITHLDGVVHHIHHNDDTSLCHIPLHMLTTLPLGLLIATDLPYVVCIAPNIGPAEEYGVVFRHKAHEYALHRIRINTIVQSDDTDITELLAFLLGHHSRFLTGAIFAADGRQIMGSNTLAERALVQSLYSLT